MANYRQIHVSIWKDEWFLDLEPAEKLLFIYLFSNEATSLAGIYKLPMKVIQFETGLDKQFILDTLSKFSEADKIHYQDGIVWVVNMRRYHETKSIKVQTRILSDIALIPNCPLKIRYLYGMNTSPQLKEEEEEEEKEEEEEFYPPFSPPAVWVPSADSIYCKVTGMAAFPGGSLQYIGIVEAMRETFGVERTIEAMKNQYQKWRSTQRKDGSGNYSGLNLTWIDRAQEELAGGDVIQKDISQMTTAEFGEYMKQQEGNKDG